MFKKNRKACLPVEWKNTYLTRQVNRSALDKLLSLNYRKQRYTPSSWKPIENNDCKYISRSYTPLTLQLRLMCNRPGYSEVKRLEKGQSLVGLTLTLTLTLTLRPRPLLFKGLRLKVASENLKRYFELSLPLTRLIAVYSNAY